MSLKVTGVLSKETEFLCFFIVNIYKWKKPVKSLLKKNNNNYLHAGSSFSL